MADEPELSPEAREDLRALGALARRGVARWLLRLSRGELNVSPEIMLLRDSSIRSVRIRGGLRVVFRPLRADELAALGRQHGQILILRVAPDREIEEWRDELQSRISELEQEEPDDEDDMDD